MEVLKPRSLQGGIEFGGSESVKTKEINYDKDELLRSGEGVVEED